MIDIAKNEKITFSLTLLIMGKNIKIYTKAKLITIFCLLV